LTIALGVAALFLIGAAIDGKTAWLAGTALVVVSAFALARERGVWAGLPIALAYPLALLVSEVTGVDRPRIAPWASTMAGDLLSAAVGLAAVYLGGREAKVVAGSSHIGRCRETSERTPPTA